MKITNTDILPQDIALVGVATDLHSVTSSGYQKAPNPSDLSPFRSNLLMRTNRR